MMDPNINIIDYYIINCAIPSIITIEYHYQIGFGKPGKWMVGLKIFAGDDLTRRSRDERSEGKPGSQTNDIID